MITNCLSFTLSGVLVDSKLSKKEKCWSDYKAQLLYIDAMREAKEDPEFYPRRSHLVTGKDGRFAKISKVVVASRRTHSLCNTSVTLMGFLILLSSGGNKKRFTRKVVCRSTRARLYSPVQNWQLRFIMPVACILTTTWLYGFKSILIASTTLLGRRYSLSVLMLLKMLRQRYLKCLSFCRKETEGLLPRPVGGCFRSG